MVRSSQSLSGRLPQRRSSQALAVLLVAIGGLLLAAESTFRRGEATVAATFLRATGQGQAVARGATVFFVHGDRWIGYVVATGCTAALLIAPFFFLAGGLLFLGRLSIRGSLLAVGAIAVLIAGINQARLWVIGASMGHWGFQSGYDRSHVLAGGVLSTVGVSLGLVLLAVMALRDRRPVN